MSEGQCNENNCIECVQLDNVNMVQCDLCDSWAHFECVGVGPEIEDKDWSCRLCLAKFDGLSLSDTKRVDAAVGTKPPSKSVDTEAGTDGTVAQTSSVQSIVATEAQDQCSVLKNNNPGVATKALCVDTDNSDDLMLVKEERDLAITHRQLEDKDIFEFYKKKLAKFGGSDVNDTVRQIGQQLLNDKVLMNYSYMGQRTKKRFRDFDNITKLVVAATVDSMKRRYLEIYGKAKLESDDDKKSVHDAAEKYFTTEFIKQAPRRVERSMK